MTSCARTFRGSIAWVVSFSGHLWFLGATVPHYRNILVIGCFISLMVRRLMPAAPPAVSGLFVSGIAKRIAILFFFSFFRMARPSGNLVIATELLIA